MDFRLSEKVVGFSCRIVGGGEKRKPSEPKTPKRGGKSTGVLTSRKVPTTSIVYIYILKDFIGLLLFFSCRKVVGKLSEVVGKFF